MCVPKGIVSLRFPANASSQWLYLFGLSPVFVLKCIMRLLLPSRLIRYHLSVNHFTVNDMIIILENLVTMTAVIWSFATVIHHVILIKLACENALSHIMH